MLDLLIKYALDHGLEAEPGFKAKGVRWAIVCDAQGGFFEVVELGDTGNPKNPGRIFPKCPDLSQGELIAGGVTKSHFLVDTAEVVALYDPKLQDAGPQATGKKVADKHGYFVQLLQNAGHVFPELKHMAQCLSDETNSRRIRERFQNYKVKATDKVTFAVENLFPLESDLWHDWWRKFRRNLSDAKSEGTRQEKIGSAKGGAKKSDKKSLSRMRCFASGQLAPPAPTHPKIERLSDVGGLPAGDVLIGFDKDAFCSYGLAQSANAAVCEEAAAAYRTALNHLIKDHGQRLSGAKVIHWFKTKIAEEDDPLPWLMDSPAHEELGAQEQAKELLESIRTSKRPDLLDNHYYALTLSGASGRVMIRDWMEGQFEELVRNVLAWFEDLSIVHREGTGHARSPKFLAVLGATVRDLKDLAPPFETKMWRVAVRGEDIPQFALAGALRRIKVDIIEDKPFNHARMGLIKAYHMRKNRRRGDNLMTDELKPHLNEDHPHAAYHCGRLMAVLAQVQRSALGDVGAGLVQRYYAAASSTPSLVLGRITRMSQFHLNKLDPGLAHWYETLIAGIWGRVQDAPPRTLDLEEQSLFALGYYQQIAHMRSKKADKVANERGEENE